MVGFVRQPSGAVGYGIPLETVALVLEQGGSRVVLCGTEIVGIAEPEVLGVIERVTAATGADADGVLLNWSHTHLAPTGGELHGSLLGEPSPEVLASTEAFTRVVQDKIVSACRLAAERLEPA